MPHLDLRRAINPSIISLILTLLRVLPSIAVDDHLPLCSTGNSRDATAPTNFIIIERQLPSNVFSLPLPLPTPITLPTNLNPPSNGSPIPLLISPYIPPSPSSSSVSLSRTSSSSLSVASKTSVSAQFSPSGNSNATTNNANGSNRLTAINFVPFIILTSFFIISLMGWCLHGWCTRRPKENFVAVGTTKRRRGWFWNRKGGRGDESDELVCGPAYVSFLGQDVEEFATVRQSGRYRWPALSEAKQDRHHTFQNKRDDKNPGFVPFEFVGVPGQTVRSVPLAKPPRGPNVGKRISSPTTTAGPMSPTSIALRDLYEVVLKNEYGTEGAEEQTSLLGVGSGVLNAKRSTSGRKRKAHVRQRSQSRDEATQLLDLSGRWLPDDDTDQSPLKKLEVRNPSVGEGRLGLREDGVGLVCDGILDEGDYMPLPTPTRVQFPVGDPPLARGRKARANAMPDSDYLPFFLSKDVLPAHPKQIMSPPLENQFYFLPLPTTAEPNDMRNDGPVVGLASLTRVRGSLKPKSTVLNARESFGERGVQNLSEVVDDGLTTSGSATTSPLRTAPVKDEHRYSSSRRNGASKGKGKLVKAKSSAKRQVGEK